MYPPNIVGPYEVVNVNPGDPAAGAGYSTPIGDNSRRLLLQVDFVLTTAVAAANRLPLVYVVPSAGTNRILGLAANVQAASLVMLWTFRTYQHLTVNSPGGTYASVNSANINPLHWLEPADLWLFDILNIQGADQVTAIHYSYLREVNPAT